MCVLTRTHMNPHVSHYHLCVHAACHHRHATSFKHPCLAECMRVKRIGHCCIAAAMSDGYGMGRCMHWLLGAGRAPSNACVSPHACTGRHALEHDATAFIVGARPIRTSTEQTACVVFLWPAELRMCPLPFPSAMPRRCANRHGQPGRCRRCGAQQYCR
jgi:hypothetical protein